MPGGSKNKAVPQRNRNQGMKHVGDRARALPTSAQSYNTQSGGQAGQMNTTARLNKESQLKNTAS